MWTNTARSALDHDCINYNVLFSLLDLGPSITITITITISITIIVLLVVLYGGAVVYRVQTVINYRIVQLDNLRPNLLFTS